MNKPIKKIIVREGLILLAVAIPLTLLAFLMASNNEYASSNICISVWLILFAGYPIYLLIRFGSPLIKLFKKLFAKQETAFLTGAIIAFALSFALRHYYIQFIVLAVALFILYLKRKGS